MSRPAPEFCWDDGIRARVLRRCGGRVELRRMLLRCGLPLRRVEYLAREEIPAVRRNVSAWELQLVETALGCVPGWAANGEVQVARVRPLPASAVLARRALSRATDGFAAVARRLGMTAAQLGAVVRGDVKRVDEHTLARLSRAGEQA